MKTLTQKAKEELSYLKRLDLTDHEIENILLDGEALSLAGYTDADQELIEEMYSLLI